jgi:hypothetical protein
MELVDQVVKTEEGTTGPGEKEFHLLFVPRTSLLCQKKLEELGVFGR